MDERVADRLDSSGTAEVGGQENNLQSHKDIVVILANWEPNTGGMANCVPRRNQLARNRHHRHSVCFGQT